jgi:hypothetical protein
MLTIDSIELRQLLGQCVVLQGKGLFSEAIALVEPRLEDMEQAAKEVSLLQLIYAANEGGYKDRCLHFAQELAKLDPELPSVKKVLATYGK